MRTGYMKNYREYYKNDNYILRQPHFTNNIDTVPNLITIYGKEAPYSVTDADASYNYLPIVYSTSDELGLGLFAGFLDSLGFNYILIHDLDKANLKKRKDQSYKPVLMTDKFGGDRGNNSINIEKKFQEILQNIKNKDISSYDKKQPICVLLHNAMTEGIDFKFNPGIFLLEVPNTYGDYDQLCGRVLRTYSTTYNVNWKDFKAGKDNLTKENEELIERWRLPNKVIYQVICLTSIDNIKLNLIEPFKVVDQNYETVDTGTGSLIQTSSYVVKPNVVSNVANAKSPLVPLGLYDTTWVENMYYGANYIGSVFTSFDVQQWYELLQQKTMFKKFIEILNKSTNEDEKYFEGVTDLEGIIECIAQEAPAQLTLLKEPMCKPISGSLDMDTYNEIRRKLNEPGGVKNFKKEYCIGSQITGDNEFKKTDTARTIIKGIHPDLIKFKKTAKQTKSDCIAKADEDEAKINTCNTTEKNDINKEWKKIFSKMQKEDEAKGAVAAVAATAARNRTGMTLRSGTVLGGKKTKKRSKMFKNKTHKRKQKLNKRKTIKKRKNKITTRY